VIIASRLTAQQRAQSLLDENGEIICILVTIVKNAEKNK